MKKVFKFIYNSIITIISIPVYILLAIIILLIGLIESIKWGDTTVKQLIIELKKNRKSFKNIFKSSS